MWTLSNLFVRSCHNHLVFNLTVTYKVGVYSPNTFTGTVDGLTIRIEGTEQETEDHSLPITDATEEMEGYDSSCCIQSSTQSLRGEGPGGGSRGCRNNKWIEFVV